MILEIMQNQDESHNIESSSLIYKKEVQRQVRSENIFAFDVKYTKIFEKRKEESDHDFFQTFENLKMEKDVNKPFKMSNVKVDENLSIKEDSYINKDILKLLNSPQQHTKIVF